MLGSGCGPSIGVVRTSRFGMLLFRLLRGSRMRPFASQKSHCCFLGVRISHAFAEVQAHRVASTALYPQRIIALLYQYLRHANRSLPCVQMVGVNRELWSPPTPNQVRAYTLSGCPGSGGLARVTMPTGPEAPFQVKSGVPSVHRQR